MTKLEDAANNLRQLAEKIVRCAERVDSYHAIYQTERSELTRLQEEHRRAQDDLLEAAEGNILMQIKYMP